MKEFAHKQSLFLRNIKKIEDKCDHLAVVTSTAPTDEVVDNIFYQAFKENNCD